MTQGIVFRGGGVNVHYAPVTFDPLNQAGAYKMFFEMMCIAVLGGFLGFLETPCGGLPGFSPASSSVATCLPDVAFSKLANRS